MLGFLWLSFLWLSARATQERPITSCAWRWSLGASSSSLGSLAGAQQLATLYRNDLATHPSHVFLWLHGFPCAQ